MLRKRARESLDSVLPNASLAERFGVCALAVDMLVVGRSLTVIGLVVDGFAVESLELLVPEDDDGVLGSAGSSFDGVVAASSTVGDCEAVDVVSAVLLEVGLRSV